MLYALLPRRRPIMLLAALLAILTLLGAVGVGLRAVRASGDTVLALEAPSDPRTGTLISVKLLAHNARNLAGFQSTVHFAPGSLRLTGARLGTDLTRSGRDQLALGPVLREDAVALGAVTCPIADCAAVRYDHPPLRTLLGVNGEVELGTIELYAATPGSYTLTLDGVQLVNPQGERLEVRTENLTFSVQE